MDGPSRSPGIPAAARTWESSLVVTFAFHCNLACTFCMVEDVLKGAFRGVALRDFERMCREPDDDLSRVKRIVLSGGEVTLSKELADYARAARSLPSAEHVRIQTNATRLTEAGEVRRLIDAGIDEFFVSVHGGSAQVCDAITQKEGSFAEIVRGLETIVACGGTLITNTALVRANYETLGDIVDLVTPLRPAWMELWNYWPRVDDRAGEFLVPLDRLRPHVVRAMEACLARGTTPVLKWFPRCLLPAALVPYHDDGQPGMLIEEEFWEREPRYGCVYEGVCLEANEGCSGLSDAYLESFGYEQDLLLPRRKGAPPPGGSAGDDPILRNLVKDLGPRRADTAIVAAWLAQLGLAFGQDVAGWTLASVARARFRDAVRIAFRRGPESIDLVVRMRSDKPALGRTSSFDVGLGGPRDASRAQALALAGALVRQMEPHDRGALELP
jgi:pyruvate-formate lyase-activating enzyme